MSHIHQKRWSNHIKVVHIIFILFIALTVVGVNAFDGGRNDEISIRLNTVKSDLALPPLERIKRLESIISESEEKSDTASLFDAVMLKAEILMKMEDLSSAEQLIKNYEQRAINEADKATMLRFDIVKLSITDAKGSNTNISNIHNDILNKVAKVDDEYLKAFAHINIANSQYVHTNNSGAIANYHEGLSISKKIGDQVLISEALSGLGNVYSEINDIDSALEHFEEAINIRSQLGDELTVSILLYNFGKTLVDYERYAEAEDVLNESASISEKINDIAGLLWTRYMQANIYLKQGKFEKSLHYYQLAADSFEKTSNTRMAFQAQLGIFDSKLGLIDIEGAKKALMKATSLSKKHSQLTGHERYLLERQAQLAAANANHKAAYEIQRKYSDSLIDFYEQQRKQNTEDLRVKYDIQSAEAKNALLEKENELNNLKIEQQAQERYLWIVLAILFFVIGFFILNRQITLRNRYKIMTLEDDLTRAPNRRAIMATAQARFNSTRKEKNELIVGIIDLDFFKKINDTYGHDVGDEVLKSFALACKKTFRQSDSFGRYGGEEWLFVISNMKVTSVGQVFDRLKETLNNMEINGLPKDHVITFSMGIASYRHDDTLQTMINRADDNLYRAKMSGRDTYCN